MSYDDVANRHVFCDPETCQVHDHRPVQASGPSALVLGGGALALSTALHLAQRRFRFVTVIARLPQPDEPSQVFPMPYDNIGHESLVAWREAQSGFGGLLNEVGLVVSMPGPTIPLGEFQHLVPYMNSQLLDRGGQFYSSDCGWIDTNILISTLTQECRKRGVFFVNAEAEELLLTPTGQIRGVQASNGGQFISDRIVLAEGIKAGRMGVNFDRQLTDRCYAVAKILMHLEDSIESATIPAFRDYARNAWIIARRNNCFEVRVEISPPYTGPRDAEEAIRGYLTEVARGVNWEFTSVRVYWYGDTRESQPLVAEHPRHEGLVIAHGGGGAEIPFCPVIGRYAADVVERGISAFDLVQVNQWRWKA